MALAFDCWCRLPFTYVYLDLRFRAGDCLLRMAALTWNSNQRFAQGVEVSHPGCYLVAWNFGWRIGPDARREAD